MLNIKDFKAPKGKFRVIGVDTFDGTGWIQGDFKTKKEAVNVALKEYIQKHRQKDMLKFLNKVDFDKDYDYKKARNR